MRAFRMLLLAVMALVTLPAQADDAAAVARLTHLLSQAQTLTARFSQLTLDLSRPIVVGILNITPDSFADGGRYLDPAVACAAAARMADAGAQAIDLGGESTRPGSQRVNPEEQLARILPVIKAIREGPGISATYRAGRLGVEGHGVRSRLPARRHPARCRRTGKADFRPCRDLPFCRLADACTVTVSATSPNSLIGSAFM